MDNEEIKKAVREAKRAAERAENAVYWQSLGCIDQEDYQYQQSRAKEMQDDYFDSLEKQAKRRPGRPRKGGRRDEELFVEDGGPRPADWQVLDKMADVRKVWLALDPKDATGHTFRAQARAGVLNDRVRRLRRGGKVVPKKLAVRRDWYGLRVMKIPAT